ncbi:alanine racemase [Alcaligenaceae bacterium]|nr:alanine racemase [Alcaligenaceae bacterium]
MTEYRCGAALIDPQAIVHNLRQLRRLLDPPGPQAAPRIWAVAKADAYGHALEHALAGLGEADGLGVLTLDDALHSRRLGWNGPILAMGAGSDLSALEDPALHSLHLIVDQPDQLAELSRLQPLQAPYVWLRHCGELHHAGLQADEYRKAYHALHAEVQAGRLAGLGHLQHYAGAENPEQLRKERLAFHELISAMPGPVCTENSAAVLSDHVSARATDWVRCGIALYGISPLHGRTGRSLGLRPAMTFQAPIYATQKLCGGQGVGYNGIFRAKRDMRIGLVRCGYADGYPRGVQGRCVVGIHGRMAAIVGRVSMDTLTIDLSGHPEAVPGDVVTLWGPGGPDIESVAGWAGTISAHLCVGLTARVPRILRGQTPCGV